MVNIAKTVSTYIKSNISGLTIYNDLFPDDSSEGIIAIHDPSTRKLNEFIDGSAIYQLNMSFTARFANAKNARSQLDAILNLLDGQKLVDDTDNLNLEIATNANVQFVATDDKQYNYYTCSISITYKTF